MEHLTQFEVALVIVCAGVLLASFANFIVRFGLNWKEE